MTVQEAMRALNSAVEALGTPQQAQARQDALAAVVQAFNEGIYLPAEAEELAEIIAAGNYA